MSRRQLGAACACAVATIVMALFAFAADAPTTTKATSDVIEGWGDVIDPDGDCRVAGTGASLEIVVPGNYHDLWPDAQGAMNAPRVLREAPAGDFTVEVRVAAPVVAEKGTEIRRGSAFRAATLLIWQDEKNFVRFDRASLFRDDKRRDFAYLHVYQDGKRTGETTRDLTAPAQPCRLKLQRRGEEIIASLSEDDGKSWKELPPQKAKLNEPLKTGVAALNSSNKPFDARFDGLIVAPTAR